MIKHNKAIVSLALASALVITLSNCSQRSEPGLDLATQEEISAGSGLGLNSSDKNIEIWPELVLDLAPISKDEKRITDLLKTMTLEQKGAQMIQPEIRDISVEDMRQYGFGSYLNGGVDQGDNLASE